MIGGRQIFFLRFIRFKICVWICPLITFSSAKILYTFLCNVYLYNGFQETMGRKRLVLFIQGFCTKGILCSFYEKHTFTEEEKTPWARFQLRFFFLITFGLEIDFVRLSLVCLFVDNKSSINNKEILSRRLEIY